jgi:hypothetical protein
MTKTIIAVEIAIFLGILVLVEWVSTSLTHSRNFWALVIGWTVYLAIRLMITAKSRRNSN